MSGFSSDWLRLREPADHAARDALTLPQELLARRRMRIVDLGSGTGSNLRYLAPRLAADQHWRLLDNDPDLLTAIPSRLREWAGSNGYTVTDGATGVQLQLGERRVDVELSHVDLATSLDHSLFEHADLVTCSALLDLFSAERLHALAAAIAASDAHALFSLSYDGRIAWQPALAGDALASELLNAHQRRDKGLGAASGPDAVACIVDLLEAHGLTVTQQRTDWQLGAAHAALQQELLDGWLSAMREQAPAQERALRDWHARRVALIERSESQLMVGHVDVLVQRS